MTTATAEAPGLADAVAAAKRLTTDVHKQTRLVAELREKRQQADELRGREGALRRRELDEQIGVEEEVLEDLREDLERAKADRMRANYLADLETYEGSEAERAEAAEALLASLDRSVECIDVLIGHGGISARLRRRLDHQTGADGLLTGEQLPRPTDPSGRFGMQAATWRAWAKDFRIIIQRLHNARNLK